jgi:hypothetical protein
MFMGLVFPRIGRRGLAGAALEAVGVLASSRVATKNPQAARSAHHLRLRKGIAPVAVLGNAVSCKPAMRRLQFRLSE